MPRVAANGIELVYDESGTGEPIVFISGTSVDRTIWGLQVVHFAPRFRCIVFDNRDAGESTMVGAAYGPRDMAADTAALLAHLDLPAAHVVGHSLGGAIAQELALLAPERVRTLALVCTWAQNDEHTRALMRSWQRMRRALDERAFLEALTLFAVGHTFLRATGAEALVSTFATTPHPQPVEAFCRQVDADLAHDAAARLGRIQAPTLVVAGDEDTIFPRHHAALLAERIPGASLVVLPAVGHSPPIESPEPFHRALDDFFASH